MALQGARLAYEQALREETLRREQLRQAQLQTEGTGRLFHAAQHLYDQRRKRATRG